MKKHKTTSSLFVCFFFLCANVFCQDTIHVITQHEFVKYISTVKMTPKEFLLVPTLSVISNTEKVEIAKRRYFVEGGCDQPTQFVSGKIYLQRKVQNSVVNITTFVLNHRTYDPDYEEKISVNYLNPISDTINLGMMYPFEFGKYIITVSIDYFYKKEKYIATSEPFEFEVSYLPEVSLFK